MKHYRQEAFSIPNLITYFRLLLIPVFVLAYFEGRYIGALACLIVSGLSDVADGYIARHFDMVTDLGKIIDPVADKLTQAAMIFCVAWHIPAMWALLAFMAVKEIVMLFWGWFALRRTGTVNSARWYGKVCTFVLYASMAALVLLPGLSRTAENIVTAVCGGVMLMSLILYSRWYIILLREQSGGERRLLLEHGVVRSHVSTILAEIIVVVLLACTVLAIIYRGELTPEALVGFTPSNLWLAALAFMLFFAVKSLTSVVYIKLIYAAAGMVFSLPAALAVNITGSVLELTIPYLIGRYGGKRAARLVLERRPKLRRITRMRSQNSVRFSMLLRASGVVPGDPLSIYLGASGMTYGPFLSGGMLGLLPTMVITTVMGDRLEDPSSPGFILAAVLFVLAQATAVSVFIIWFRRNNNAADTAGKGDESCESAQ